MNNIRFLVFHGVNRLIARKSRIRMIRVMRGYRRLRVTGELSRIAKVKEALTITPVCSLLDPMRFMGLNSEQAELVIRQFLLSRRVANGLGEALLESVGNHNSPVRYALPLKWREVLRSHGFPVAERASMLLWAGFCTLYFAKGLLTLSKLFLANVVALFGDKERKYSRYVFFDELSMGNLPKAEQGDYEHNIINWYLGWGQRASEIDQVCHGVKNAHGSLVGRTPVIPMDSPLLPLVSWRAFIQFIKWGSHSIFSVFVGMVKGDWWPAVIFGESSKAAQIRYQQKQMLACDYLFNNSNWIYRPQWTYEAERKGSRIIFYFYSTNCEKVQDNENNNSLAYGWQAMSWPQYVVWDDYQLEFIRRAVGSDIHIDIAGPIPFISGTSIPPDLPEHFIAVFDVQPMRNSVYQVLGIEFEYYVPRNSIRFLYDIQHVTLNIGMVMVLKRKRDVRNKLHPAYKFAIERLKKNANYIELNPDVSATALIDKCRAVISTPFTSTALIGRMLGKPTAYYDPYKILNKYDPASHGIQILQEQRELQEWLSYIINSES